MSAVDNRADGDDWSAVSESSLAQNFPLHRACRDGDVAALAALLQGNTHAHAHLTLEDTYYGWTPAHWAAYFGKLECLKALVASSQVVSPGMTTSRFTQTPAHIAAFAGHPHCLLWLLQTGVNPNAQDYLGETSLHKAARTGSMDCVNVLLSNKVQTGIPNNNGQTAAQLANACSYTDLANYLLQVEGKQGLAQTNGSISRSVPGHGLNGGVFPHSPDVGSTQKASTPTNGFLSQSSQNGGSAVNGGNSTCTSSNGYYGFQPANSSPSEGLNGRTNGAAKPPTEEPEDCEMETDANPVTEIINGKDKPTQPFLGNHMAASQNGISNGQHNGAVSAYTNGSLQNGPCKVANGHTVDMSHTNGSPVNHTSVVHKMLPRIGADITLSDGVSKNYIPIAGCKRSREDVYVPEMKRMKTDDGRPVKHFTLQPSPAQPLGKQFQVQPPPSQPQPIRQQPPSQPPVHGQVSSSMVDHFLTVKMEDGYENMNFEAMMAEVHGC